MKASSIIFCFIFAFLALVTSAAEMRNTGLLLDVSRSVASPEEFAQIKGIIKNLIDQNVPPDVLYVYTFGNKLQRIDVNELQSIQPSESNTMLYDAVYDAMKDLSTKPGGLKSILIFSDGKDTKSVTIAEDVVNYARDQKVTIHCVGMGNANQKLLERIAKLTGGRFFSAEEPDLVSQIKMAIAAEKQIDQAETPRQESVPVSRADQPAAAPVSSLPKTRIDEGSNTKYLWIAGILGAALIGVFVMALRRRQTRVCPICQKPLESYQTVCPDCPGQTLIQSTSDLSSAEPKKLSETQEMNPAGPADRKIDTQEILSKTYFLDETPVLVVTKGSNVGESFRLSKELPVSIGRSRLNEIRPDDGSISAQHCRIIPENGEYVLYDLGSTNGTIVNNINVNKAVLEEGDMIKVGATVLLFTLHQTT